MLENLQTINLTPLIQAVIILLATWITARLVPLIRARTTKEQQANLSALVRVLVYAAEQVYGAGNGPEKLEYVCRALRKRGWEVDLPQIEAAVYEAFNEYAILRPGNTIHDGDDAGKDGEKAAGFWADSEKEYREEAESPGQDSGIVPMPVLENGEPDLEVTHWTLEQLQSFCRLNDIGTDGCVTREDYLARLETRAEEAPESDNE